MAKPTKDGNLKASVDLRALFNACVQDLRLYLHPSDMRVLLDPACQLDEVNRTLSELLSSTGVYDNILRYSSLRQLEALLKKNQDLPGGNAQSRRDTALKKFNDAEKRCRITNKRLHYYFRRSSRIPTMVREVLATAQSISYDIFGSLTRLNFQDILEGSGFGPGTTFTSEGVDGHHLYYKVGGNQSFTDEALPYVRVMFHHRPAWKEALVTEHGTYTRVRGNRIAFVPKDSATYRTIAIEPSLNVFLQKGVESYLTGRLRRFGVSLTNQGRNQSIAEKASRVPLLASTLDLSSASDSVSIEIVRYMLPSDWFILLDDLRSHEYTLDKGSTWQRYSKFSSMGNAFTFPLESAIFFSIAKACTIYSGGDLSVLRVYGDDIIIDPKAALLLCEVLKFAGFSVNTEKSFFHGPFRETCGADYLAGVDVRPVYVKDLPRNDQQVYNLFNRLLRNRIGFRFHNLCEILHDYVKKPFYGPPDLAPGLNYDRWYAGKAVIYDHYFHAPSFMGERFKRYDPDTQAFVWKLQILRFKPKRMDTTHWLLQFHYLAFLYGLSGNDYVESLQRFRRTLPYENFVRWSEPPWRPALFDCLVGVSGSTH